jgi:hypothetical protein
LPGTNTSLLRKFVNSVRKKFYNIGSRKKIKQREEEEEKEERCRKKAEEEERERKQLEEQRAAESIPPPPPPPPAAEPPRNPVAIQWGSSGKNRKTPDRLVAAKRMTAFVGKMPGRNGKKWTPEPECAPEKKSSPPPPPASPPPPPPLAEVAPMPKVPKEVTTPSPKPTETSKTSPTFTRAPNTEAEKLNLQQILEAAQAHIRNRNHPVKIL